MAEPGSPRVRFELLGAVRAWRGDRELALGPPAQRLLLTVLLAREGSAAGLDELAHLLWDDEPPASAANVIQRYVGALRRVIEPDLASRAQGRWLLRRAGGYVLQVDAESSDLAEFRAGVARARRAEDPGEALAAYVEALRLCRGAAGAGKAASTSVTALLSSVDREVSTALLAAADLASATGQSPQPLLAHLERVAALDPFDEGVHARLMRALSTVGRRALALEVHRDLRNRLVAELGVEPGPELAKAHREVLAEPALAPAPAPRPAPAAVSPVRPAQLPPGLAAFTGREAEVAALSELLTVDGPVMPLVVIDGLAGTGKTSLAVHVAHRLSSRFPDGQLYVNMQGFDPAGAVVDPLDAVRGFIEVLALGSVPVPNGLDAGSGLYRSLLVGRRMLVVVDNVRDAEQVRPLLPGAPGCAVIVTSRNRLGSLVVSDGAEVLTLDTLTAADARRTLARRLGEDRVAAEPGAVDEITRLCGRLPLALAIVAARVRTRPQLTLAALAETLRETRGTLDAFGTDGVGDVRTVFSWSYRILSPAAARLFRLLALHRGADISVDAAASVAGIPVADARALLEELIHIRYVTESRPDRYSAHDLIRSYSLELVQRDESAGERAAALRRLVDHFRCVAHEAGPLLRPLRPGADRVPVPAAGVTVTKLGGYDDAVAWFEAELSTLTLLARQLVADPVYRTESGPFVLSLLTPYQRSGRAEDWAAVTQLALPTAEGDDALTAQLHRSLAGAYFVLRRGEDSLDELDHAMKLLTDDAERAFVHTNYGYVLASLDRYEEAAEHQRRGAELHRTVGNEEGEIAALCGLAFSVGCLGRREEALALAQRAAAFYEAAGDRNGVINCWLAIASTHEMSGDLAAAEQIWLDAIRRHLDMRSWNWAIELLAYLADRHSSLGDEEGSQKYWQQALALIDEHGLPDLFGARERVRPCAAPSAASSGRT
ncbi:BTAD domain-containing putative transcriptional regulator [Amycolatopsis rhabdoformis]|uniref:BTAD domain-containing putative transcriptional regulator n=1 Tax=Amycolatopsis rhabdoformis TaxID=1448059 RepID=A0ABZ1IMD4_9PSEU|nr:BTAD domain-containing putative transcriptional regulator [Amycolatopsis rhabdoformis]WSE35006.1 BTAD domain-containing putative transcriptional regulator [Amycolatopsis rhabdoformis]